MSSERYIISVTGVAQWRKSPSFTHVNNGEDHIDK